MILLDTSLKKLQLVLSGAKTSVDAIWTADFAEVSNYGGIGGGPPTPQNYNVYGTTNGATAVDVVGAPGVGNITRQVNRFSLFNKDTGAITVTIRENDNGTIREIIQLTLQVGETLQYEDDQGFVAIDVNGNIKTTAPASSGAASTAQSIASVGSSQASSIAAVYPTTSSQASSLAGINVASVNSTSSQASSIAAAINPASINSVSSQASSMAALVPASVSSQASSMVALLPASVSSQASSIAVTNPATVSSLQSAASVQSFTSTTWSTVSSATSRVKSSFSW